MLLLFLGFYRNQWNAARDKKFSNVDKLSEGLVIGRLVQSRQFGIFSDAAFIGMGDTDPSNIKELNTNHQYDTYLNSGTFRTYFTYRSQNSGEAMFFGLLDSISPFSPGINLRLFRGITALFTAITIGLLITWIFREFGFFSAVVALLTTITSQWLTVFGRNIFWGIWLYFLPFLAVTFSLEREKHEEYINNLRFAAVFFAAIFLKCLFSGYDFISTAAISACIPILYYAILEHQSWFWLLKKMMIGVVSATAAITLSLAVLAGQIGFLEGSYQEGIRYIVNSVARRTYGDPNQYPIYAASLQANVSDVVFTYLTGDQIFHKLPVNFLQVTTIFLFFSGTFFLFDLWKKRTIPQREKGYALIAATWLAFVSSISTYIVFKSASYIHTFLYYIVWHLPFTILGFAMCGYVLKLIYQTLFIRPMTPQNDLKLA